jgi:hypothetical protein
LLGPSSFSRRLSHRADPAPLHGQMSAGAPGYMVVFHEDVEVQPTAWALAAKYDFTPSSISDLGFSADFPDATLDGLRCEELVRYVEHLVEPAPPPGTS